MTYWNKICGIALFLLCVGNSTLAQSPPIMQYKPSILKKENNFNKKNLFNSADQRLFTTLLSSNYYTQNLGFFCKKELAVEKYLKVPLRIRLGSVQQCDYLEGKQAPRKLTP